LNDFDHTDEEDDFDSRNELSEYGDVYELACCNAIGQLLDHLVCERSLTFGGCLKDLCVSDIFIPSIANDVNSGLDMLLTSTNLNSGCCSQLLVQAILTTLGPSKVEEFASEEQALIQEGVLMLLSKHFEKKRQSHRIQDAS
jgi:hypothetical protein